MNRSTTSNSSRERESFSPISATRDELTVAQILLDLRILLLPLSVSLADSNWGRRRRRSCLDAAAPLLGATSCPSPSVQRTENKIEDGRVRIRAEVGEKHDGAARTTGSPDTPLSFSPSDESDDKSKYSSKKTCRKRSKEEYLDMIEELTRTRDSLRGEINVVENYYKRLKIYNSQLKAMKHEVRNSSSRKEETQMEINGELNQGIELAQHYRMQMLHHQPSTANPTMQELQCSFGLITAHIDNGPGLGPLGFDLNVPIEEAFGVDLSQPRDVSTVIAADKRARFAEARRKRMRIIKIKSSKNGV